MRDRLLLTVRRSVAVVSAGLVVGVLSGVIGAAPAAAADPVFTIAEDQISGPVGIATDTATSSYWLVNQTGADMVAFSRTGEVKGTVDFRADPVDVQAAAYRSGRLYVGDIGDRSGERDFVSVFLFPNLTPDAGTVTYQSWDLSYPDGAHDAKAMVVDTSGRVFVITSGDDAGIYAAPTDPSRLGVNELERVADAPAGVTDAVALSKTRWALRTGTTVQEIDAETYKKVAETSLPVRDGDTLGIDLAASSGSSVGLVAGSAGASADVYAFAAPSVAPPGSPPPSAGPSSSAASPTAAPSGAAAQDPAEDQASDSARSGTWLAIGLAALVAVLAGAVAYLWPGRRSPKGVVPVRAAPPPRTSSPPMERPVTRSASASGAADEQPAAHTDDGFARAQPLQPWASPFSGPPPGPVPSPTVWPETQSFYGAARASVDPSRHRPPGDIEDDDPFDDTTIRANQVNQPGRRAEGLPPVAPSEPPRRSLGYDPELWGEETLRRRPGAPPPEEPLD